MNAGMGAGGSAHVVRSRLSQNLLPAINAVRSGKPFVSPSLMFKPDQDGSSHSPATSNNCHILVGCNY